MKNIMLQLAGIILTIIMVDPACAQTNSEGEMPQFLFSDFTTGTVKMKNGKTQSIMLNYNTITEKMVYKQNEKLYDMISTDMIDTVFIKNSRFVPKGKAFYELLVEAPFALFIQHKGNLMSPGAPAAYGGYSQVSSSKYLSSIGLEGGYYNLKLPQDFIVKPEPVFWIKNGEDFQSFVSEKQYLKIFPGKEPELKKFIKQNRIKFDRIPDLIRLVKYANEILR